MNYNKEVNCTLDLSTPRASNQANTYLNYEILPSIYTSQLVISFYSFGTLPYHFVSSMSSYPSNPSR